MSMKIKLNIQLGDCGMGMCGVCLSDHEAQGKCAEEVCRRKVDAAESRDTRREEEALVTAVAMTYN